MDRTIYIVKGQTGIYDAYTTWDVRAFNSEIAAIAWVSYCESEAKKALGKRKNNNDEIKNIADPDMLYYDSKISYFHSEVPLAGE